jgi:hypothetical protein
MIEGTRHYPPELDERFLRIFMGVGWPAVHPGYVVVVGEHRAAYRLGAPVLEVLDEATDPRLWHVVEQAAALQRYYQSRPLGVAEVGRVRLLGDGEHVAAMQFVAEFAGRVPGFGVEHSLLCAMKGPFGYAFPILERMLGIGRLVIPAGAKLGGWLQVPPRQTDLATLRLSDFPAVAALAFAVLGLEQTRPDLALRAPVTTVHGGRVLG